MTKTRLPIIILVAIAAAGLAFLVSRKFIPAPEGAPLATTPIDNGIVVDADASPSPAGAWPTPPSSSPLTTQSPTPAPVPSDSDSAAILVQLNAERAGQGLSPLAYIDTLTALAQGHADDMAARTYLDHVTPEGVTFRDRIDASDYSYSTAAENLGFSSHVDLIIPDWMRSPGHRANMLNEQFTEVGVAVARGTWQGVAVTYVAVVFARPR